MQVLVIGNQLLFGGASDSQWSFFVSNYQEYEAPANGSAWARKARGRTGCVSKPPMH